MDLFLFLPEVGRLSLRRGGLLGLQWTGSHHMVDALAEVALLGLGRQLAFLGMMVQTTTVIAPGTRQNGKGEGNMAKSLKPLTG